MNHYQKIEQEQGKQAAQEYMRSIRSKVKKFYLKDNPGRAAEIANKRWQKQNEKKDGDEIIPS